ncbi:hypothetical protein ACFL2Q_14665, partial [Thermodesulfobacteriota bacterium]
MNGYYDATELGQQWYGFGGFGLEFAAIVAGHDLVELNFNYYGLLLDRAMLRNAFRKGPGNFDVTLAYSHELYQGGPDAKVKVSGYKFETVGNIYGWNVGVELKSRNGAFSVKAEAGRDPVNSSYYSVGGFVNVGLQLEKLL